MPAVSQYTISPTAVSGLPGRIMRDEANGLEVTILDRGAEPVSLRLRDAATGAWVAQLAREDQVSPDSPWRPLHFTHLGFHAHTIINQLADYEGEPVRGSGHGLLPDFPHKRISEHVSDKLAAVTYTIEPGDYSRERYPRALGFSIEQKLQGGWLEVAYTVENREPSRPVHLSFGAHPAYPIAQPENYRIQLAPGRYRQWLIDGAVHLTGETRDVLVPAGAAGETFNFPWTIASLSSPVMLEIMDVLVPACVATDPVTGQSVEYDLVDRPYLTFWSNSPKFVCIEPIWGLPDAAVQTAFQDKPGILTVPVGGRLTKRFRIRPFHA